MSGDDTSVNVERLCCRAVKPLKSSLFVKLNEDGYLEDMDFKVGAVCVYPARVVDCVNSFKKLDQTNMNIAAVATGFPSGQYGFETRIQEVHYALENGANEIDVVIDRCLALNGKWKDIYNEVKRMKQICKKKNAHLKVILEVGELGSLENVYKASMASMLAGADFIKTSTGKTSINATLPVGIIMTRAIWEFNQSFGIKVGFKPAGGLRSSQDALEWVTLILMELGPHWLNSKLFRIGASSLLNDIEKTLFKLVIGRNPHHYEVSL